MIDAEGMPFHDPVADAALFDALRADLDRSKVELVELDLHINDPAFADAMADRLLAMLDAAHPASIEPEPALAGSRKVTAMPFIARTEILRRLHGPDRRRHPHRGLRRRHRHLGQDGRGRRGAT